MIMKEVDNFPPENSVKIRMISPRQSNAARKSRKAKPQLLIITNAHYIGGRSMSAAFEQALTLPQNSS